MKVITQEWLGKFCYAGPEEEIEIDMAAVADVKATMVVGWVDVTMTSGEIVCCRGNVEDFVRAQTSS